MMLAIAEKEANCFLFFSVTQGSRSWICRSAEMATLVAQQAIDSAYLLAISTKDEFPTIDYEGSSYITFNHAPSVFH
jgi:hypothetical protein